VACVRTPGPRRSRAQVQTFGTTGKELIRERASGVNRIQKLHESANLKLASVATDVVGASARAMLKALVSGGHDPEHLAELAKGTLRAKRGDPVGALSGRFRGHHAFMVGQSLIAEMGVDVTCFASSAHFASWAGPCPGNNESGGKRRSARARKGKRWLKTTLVEAALAAKKQRRGYLAAIGRRLGGRRGPKHATIAVAHAIGVTAGHVLAGAQPYRDLGPHHFDRLAGDRLRRHHVRRLRQPGFRVALDPAA
jgi:transposase